MFEHLTGEALIRVLTAPERAKSTLEDVQLPLGVIRIRALSRDEVLASRRAADVDPAQLDGPRVLVIERKILALAIVSPVMTEDQIAAWQRGAPAGELDEVMAAVERLSAIDRGAAKAAFR